MLRAFMLAPCHHCWYHNARTMLVWLVHPTSFPFLNKAVSVRPNSHLPPPRFSSYSIRNTAHSFLTFVPFTIHILETSVQERISDHLKENDCAIRDDVRKIVCPNPARVLTEISNLNLRERTCLAWNNTVRAFLTGIHSAWPAALLLH